MISFLEHSAATIFGNHNINELKNVKVILPSRRAVHFFKRELSLLSKKAFLSPNIISIDDYIIQLSGLSVISKLDLHFRVFDLLKKLDVDLTFEKYASWAPILLKDFENIDLALVKEVHLLFRYMSESDAISRWNLEEDYEFTENANSYFSFFEKIAIVYDELKRNLLESNLCYKGLAYRKVAENLSISLNDEFTKYYFVGLNALSNAEEEIVKSMVLNNNATCIWDTDEYYINSNNKAGKKLRYYKSSGKFGEWNNSFTFLKSTDKSIDIIAIKNDILQTKFVLNSVLENQEKRQVVVILDENQFKPLIFSLPTVSQNFNISRGIAITSTKFYGVLELYFDIHEELLNSNKIHAQYFIKIVEHELLGSLLEKEMYGDNFESLKAKLKESKLIYINRNWLVENNFISPTIDLLFNSGTENQYFYFENLRKLCDNIIKYLENSESDELVFVNTILSKIIFFRDLSKKREDISIKDIFSLLKQELQSENIPFAANPEANIQVMSMLETRCLDFETVTILSLNEGNLPSTQKNRSFIPNDAAKIFGLPLYSDQDAIMAYHFFRLMQRAKKVNLLYLLQNSGGVGTVEKSRFILQIEKELVSYNPKIKLNYPQLVFRNTTYSANNEIFIEKDAKYVEKIKNYLLNKGFYPSHLNDFFDCSLRFYWKRIDKLSKVNEIKENFQPDVFGNILHYTLELIDKKFFDTNTLIEKEDLEYIKTNIPSYLEQVLANKFKSYEIEIGLNSVLKTLIIKLLEDYLETEIVKFIEPIKIIGNELHMTSVVKVFFENEELDVMLSGIIDRIDQRGKVINLIDYKSGKVTAKELESKNENYFDEFQNPNKSKLRQLLTYKYLIENGKPLGENKMKDISSNTIIIPRIISFRNLKEGLSLNPERLNDTTLEITKSISEVTNLLLNDKFKIQQTEDKTYCEFCDFRTICKRD